MIMILTIREDIKVEILFLIIIALFYVGGGIRGHYRTFYFNYKMAQFIQKCKENVFPLVRGDGGRGVRGEIL